MKIGQFPILKASRKAIFDYLIENSKVRQKKAIENGLSACWSSNFLGTTIVPVSAAGGEIFISRLRGYRASNPISWLLVTVGLSLMT